MNAPRKIKVGLIGANGKMGKELTLQMKSLKFKNQIELSDSVFNADVVIDFSSPAGVLGYCEVASKKKIKTPLVVGSTGWTPSEFMILEKSAESSPILRASNFSLGIQICRMTLGMWKNLSLLKDWTISIRDLHHAAKKDAPSGTALSLREALGRDVSIESIREGEVVGIHEIIFKNDDEILRLIHEAKSRGVFAVGALEAAIEFLKRVRDDKKNLPTRLLGLDDLYLRSDA